MLLYWYRLENLGKEFRRRLISVFVILSMFTMILIDSYHVGFFERYNSLVSLYASFGVNSLFRQPISPTKYIIYARIILVLKNISP
jgi:hypothetical protein